MTCIIQPISLYLRNEIGEIMKIEKQKLMIEQLDKKFKSYQNNSNSIIIPSNGWVYTIRKSLNMSLKQLAKRLKVTSQNINQLELREKQGTISLNKMKEIADALEMKLIYSFIPKEDSLEKMIEKRAYQVAKEIVLRTSHSMSLEDQENLPDRLEKAIKDKAEQIKNELPRYIWD